MGYWKNRAIEESEEAHYKCPLCGEVISCSKEDLEIYKDLGCCDYCNHIQNKDD